MSTTPDLQKTVADPSFDATLAAGAELVGKPQAMPAAARTTLKSCVLPRFANDVIVHEDRDRYEVKQVIGEGGMGEVALAIDHDIGRPVALKHLHHQTAQDAASLARFVEEIHTVGALEHPNIVPIHDVGVGADGRYFFVMKHVQGETLEAILEKLAAGDAATHARFTYTTRIEIMIGLLRALDYAHAQGIVHRDIKPANIMIGPFGEVVLMDWGVAKGKLAAEPTRAPEDGKPLSAEDARARMFTTRHGSLVGTPAYMSPEQARGENASIDERSDLYSATVLFYELITLRHYLESKTTLETLLKGVIDETPPIFSFSYIAHPAQPLPAAELMHFCARGLMKAPAERWQSARDMIQRLEDTLEGKVHVQCPFTMTKRMTREAGFLVDRHPYVAVGAFVGTIALVLTSLVVTLRAVL